MASINEVVKVSTTLTITIEDHDEDEVYIVEHEADDRCICVWETCGGARKIALSIHSAAARSIANALLKCADKAEGEVA